MVNYHRHSYYSNPFTSADSCVSNEDYAKRAVELGQTVLATTEHGWFGNQFEVNDLAKKYNLKWIFGAEAYWVWNRHEKDKTNAHIILLAKNENGRKAITSIISKANKDDDAYYYGKARLDKELLLSLPRGDVVVTTACLGFWGYGLETCDSFVMDLFLHFGSNFFLEIQSHHTEAQIELNRHILEIHKRRGIPLIAGMDSHYIFPEQAQERTEYLRSQNISYPEEDGWYMDYPDEETFFQRFKEQGVFTDEEIREAIDNTNICLTFEDYTKDNPIFTPLPKIPVPEVFKGMSQDEINSTFSRLISKKFQEYMKNIDPADYQKYYDGVKEEVNVYKETKMALYPLLDYLIVQEAVKNGGMITPTGRGSGCSYFTNTLCGFSKVDRFKVPIPLYPERFISKTRILETRSLPDLDLNLANPEVFEAAQKKIMGDDHAYPMIAWGTVKKKSAFKLYARAKNLDFSIANTVSAGIGNYELAVSNAEDDEKDMIDIYDYVDEKYRDLIEESKSYWGIVTTKLRAPCAHLLYDGNISEEIGIIRCKSESTGREYLVAAMDGKVAESMKFLKNDLLKVNSVLLLNLIFDRIGQPIFDTEELTRRTKNDSATWEIYSKGLTQCINQCEKPSTTEKLKRYKPENVAELSYFIAAIRPGFKSMYRVFESRAKFDYGIKALDDLLQTKDMHSSFMIFQENVMGVLNYAGFPMSETYQIIKNIAKKHPEKVRPLKERFLTGFKTRLIEDEKQDEETALANAEKVWQIINDNCSYSFNSCLAGDERFVNQFKMSELTIEQMYKAMTDEKWAKENNLSDYRDTYIEYGYGFSSSWNYSQKVIPNKIVDIRLNGEQDVYKVTTSTGKTVKATLNHKFPTSDGEKRLDELQIGDYLFVFEDSKVRQEDVSTIEYYGKQMTYDVEMAAPYHNFMLENGLIVSNSHAVAMAYDSLYLAYLKAHYPYEFYETVLQFYSLRGEKDKVRLIKQEMKAFGISEGQYKFGLDNRAFKADPEHYVIYPSLSSIKSMSQSTAESLYILGQQKFESFLDIYLAMKEARIPSDQIKILIHMNYFSDYANQHQIDDIIFLADHLLDYSKVNLEPKDDSDRIPNVYLNLLMRFCDEKMNFLPAIKDTKEELALERDKTLESALSSIVSIYKTKKASLVAIKEDTNIPEVQKYITLKEEYKQKLDTLRKEVSASRLQTAKEAVCFLQGYILQNVKEYSRIYRIRREYSDLGYLTGDYSRLDSAYRIVADIDEKYATRKVALYVIQTGEEKTEKVFAKTFSFAPLKKGDIVRVLDETLENKHFKNEVGEWVPSDQKEWILRKYECYSDTPV